MDSTAAAGELVAMLIRMAGQTHIDCVCEEEELYDGGPAITIVRGVCRSWRESVVGDELLSMWERTTLSNFLASLLSVIMPPRLGRRSPGWLDEDVPSAPPG